MTGTASATTWRRYSIAPGISPQRAFFMGRFDWAVSLIGDGVLGGIGAVLTFIPQIVMLFCSRPCSNQAGICRGVLSSRQDFHPPGSFGRALIPFIVGFGWRPRNHGHRTLENEQERKRDHPRSFHPLRASCRSFPFAGFFLPNIAFWFPRPCFPVDLYNYYRGFNFKEGV